jgi:hypothetical protein
MGKPQNDHKVLIYFIIPIFLSGEMTYTFRSLQIRIIWIVYYEYNRNEGIFKTSILILLLFCVYFRSRYFFYKNYNPWEVGTSTVVPRFDWLIDWLVLSANFRLVWGITHSFNTFTKGISTRYLISDSLKNKAQWINGSANVYSNLQNFIEYRTKCTKLCQNIEYKFNFYVFFEVRKLNIALIDWLINVWCQVSSISSIFWRQVKNIV